MSDPTARDIPLTAQEEIDRIRAAYFDDEPTAPTPPVAEPWGEPLTRGWSGL